MKRKIPTFEEYMEMKERKLKHLHRIDEMANVSRPNDNIPKNTKIVVFPEGDIQGTKTPHFHVLIYGGEINLEIKIENIYKMEIWRTKNNYPKSWDGLTDVRDRIIEWLDEKSKKDYGLTNLQKIVLFWNINNPTNEIDDKFVE